MTIQARDVPALVHLHQDYLRGTAYQRYATRYLRSAWTKTNPRFQEWATEAGFELDKAVAVQGVEWCDDEYNLLNIARLFHVTEPMVEVAKHAARQLSDDDLWNREALPATAGVLVFEKPLRVEDVWGRVLGFSAVSWHWRTGFHGPAPGQPKYRSDWTGRNDQAIQFNFYSDSKEPGDDYTPELQRLRQENPVEWGGPGGRWELNHMQAHFDGSKIGPFDLRDAHDDLYDDWRKSYTENNAHLRYQDPAAVMADHAANPPELMGEYVVQSTNITRILYSIFALMDQTITVLEEYTDKRLARRTRDKRRPPPMVTIMKLRHAKSHGQYSSDGSWLTYRSVTAGHWRWQPYGPGRSQVKHIWINPYIRGPEDAPFHRPERVSTLAR
jgi:hypothetical protein